MDKGKVLVIDDSPIVRKLAEMALADEGYQVVTAENGEDGLRLAEELVPEVILVDFIMPRMSGYQFCQLVRENQLLKDIPIILITAKGDDVGRKFSERFAVSDYFIKPFKSEALVDKVNSIVQSGREAAKETTSIEPPVPFDVEPSVAVPFAFGADHAAVGSDLVVPELPETPAVEGAPFPFPHEREEEFPALEHELPVAFDASAFAEEPPAQPLIEPEEITSHEEAPVTDVFAEESSVLELETGHDEIAAPSREAESPSGEYEHVKETSPVSAPEMPREPVAETRHIEMPSAAVATGGLAAAGAAIASIYAVSHASEPKKEEHVAVVAEVKEKETEPIAEAVMPSADVTEYLERKLPFIVQKSVENILKQSGIVRDEAIIFSGRFGVLTICDVLATIEGAGMSGKLFAFLATSSMELFFERGKAIGASMSSFEGIKKGVEIKSGADVAAIREVLLDAVGRLLEADEGAFSFDSSPLSEAALSVPLRLSRAELLPAVLRKVPDETFADCVEKTAVLTRTANEAVVGTYALGEAERSVLSGIDGKKTVADVVNWAGGDAAAEKAIYTLLQLRIIGTLG
ncbi:MAG TPA: response regulator [Dissulfurispiraceae bacterium]|nr:response regulator [Dissulfurispiraceae bacterium]